MCNNAAKRVERALARWAIADDQLAAAAGELVQQIATGSGGKGSYDALEALKRHLMIDRYHVPTIVIRACRGHAA